MPENVDDDAPVPHVAAVTVRVVTLPVRTSRTLALNPAPLRALDEGSRSDCVAPCASISLPSPFFPSSRRVRRLPSIADRSVERSSPPRVRLGVEPSKGRRCRNGRHRCRNGRERRRQLGRAAAGHRRGSAATAVGGTLGGTSPGGIGQAEARQPGGAFLPGFCQGTGSPRAPASLAAHPPLRGSPPAGPRR